MAGILQVDVPDYKDSLRNVEMEEDAPNPSESSIKTNSYSNQELLLAETEEADKEDVPNPSESSTKTNSYSNEELLLAEDGDEEYEETDDESDDNELEMFLSLMNKAEKKNEKRIQKKKNQFGSTKIDWSNVRLDDVKTDEDTTESEDEDDHEETTKFMSLMSKAKEKNSVIKLSYVQGKMQMTKMSNGHEGQIMYNAMKEKMSKRLESVPSHEAVKGPPSSDSSKGLVTITRVSGPRDEQDIVQRRKEEFRAKMSGQEAKSLVTKGKRKFEDRMTLSEASADDFNDGQDYVNFLQDKLQGIKIKLVK